MKIRTLLVDDEDLARAALRRELEPSADIEIVDEAVNGVEAIEKIGELRPDLVLLDIEMPGFDGFEVVQHLSDPPVIVFVTAYDEYAVRAFEANAVDYLLKPVQPERLERALARVMPPIAISGLRVSCRARRRPSSPTTGSGLALLVVAKMGPMAR